MPRRRVIDFEGMTRVERRAAFLLMRKPPWIDTEHRAEMPKPVDVAQLEREAAEGRKLMETMK